MQTKTKYFIKNFNAFNLARLVKIQIEKEFEFRRPFSPHTGEVITTLRKRDQEQSYPYDVAVVYAALQNMKIYTGILDYFSTTSVKIHEMKQVTFDMDDVLEITHALEVLVSMNKEVQVGALAYEEPELRSFKDGKEEYWTFEDIETHTTPASRI